MRYFLAIIALILLVIAAVVFRARPQYLGTLDVLSVRQDVEVYYDSYGVPHIYAASAEDAYQTLGYVHAQDRLFQMELLRRAGSGRLAEVFGPKLTEVDKMFRTFGTPDKAMVEAARMREQANTEAVKLATAYLEGVNRYISEGRSPLEFTIAGIDCAPFGFEDIHYIAGAMSFNFAQGLRTDPLLSHLRDILDDAYLADLDLGIPEDNIDVPVYPQRRDTIAEPEMNRMPSLIPPRLHMPSDGLSLYDEMGIGVFYGSNTWAVAPQNTEDSVTLLANDTHIGYAQPCTWYEAHLEYPGVRLYGNYMAGIPFPLVGHTDQTAWGVTMLLNDDMDIYCEQLSPSGKGTMYLGQEVALVQTVDTIKVKGAEDSIFTRSVSKHGPIVTDFVMQKDSSETYSLRWTYLDTHSDLLQAFYDLGRAQNMAEAKSAVSLISAPGLNISYADAAGNIALWAAGRLTHWPDHVDSRYVLDGASGNDEPLGYHPFEANPSLENPPWGYIFSANNQHQAYTGDKPAAGYYEPDDRASRIVHKLEARKDWSVQAMKRLALDDYSERQEAICKHLVSILRTSKLELNETESEALDMLKDWDGSHNLEAIGASIHYRFLYEVIRMAMVDEIGKPAFDQFLSINCAKPSIERLINSSDSPWWDNVRTDETKENRSLIVQRAYHRTIKGLVKSHGDRVVDWTWEQTHQTKHKHAFSDIPLVGNWLSVGPFGSPGGVETINNSMFYLSSDSVIYAKHGPQMRIVVNLNDIENSVSILPTGQSGMRLSPHYEDQAEMYIKGNFRPQHMNRQKIERKASKLVFTAGE